MRKRPSPASHRKTFEVAEIEKTFRAAFVREYANEPGVTYQPWTEKEKAIIYSVYVKRWTGPAELCHEFFDWVVREWFNIRGKSFRWMKRDAPPMTPNAAFLIQRSSDFRSAFRDRKIHEATAGMSDGDERRLRELIASGMTREAAIARVGEERATEAMREKNRQAYEAQSLGFRLMKKAEQEVERAKRVARGEGYVHPSSIRANEIAKLAREEARMAEIDTSTLPSLDELAKIPFRE